MLIPNLLMLVKIPNSYIFYFTKYTPQLAQIKNAPAEASFLMMRLEYTPSCYLNQKVLTIVKEAPYQLVSNKAIPLVKEL